MNAFCTLAAPARTLAFGLLISMAMLVVPVGVRADRVDPGSWSRFDGWEITSFVVTGVPEDLRGEVVPRLQHEGRWKLLRGKVRPPFSAKGLADDIRRIRLHLAQRGYPAPTVRPDLTPDPAARRLAVLLEIDPGPVVRVGALELVGWPADVPQPTGDDGQVIGRGDRFEDEAVTRTDAYLRALLLNAGYAQAVVEPSVRHLGERLVAVTFQVEPGDFFVISAVEIRGCAEDLVPVARRALDIQPGVEFSQTVLDDGALDLRTSQLFRQVELMTESTGPGELALTAELADARMRSLQASVGTWSDNPWMVRASWTHRNLFKRGRGLRLQSTLATHETMVGAEVFKLGWLSSRALTTLGAAYRMEDEDAYLSEEYGARLLQSFRPRGLGFWNVGVGLSRVFVESRSIDLEEVPDSQDWLLETWVDRKWDWTDDMIYPTRGGYGKLSLIVAPPASFLGAAYVQVSAEGSKYVALSDRFLGAGRLRLGTSKPLGGNDDLLANRRFYAGGYNTMRGYDRRKLGPRDAENKPRGGQTIALAGLELRSRLVARIDLAVFLDTGQVWRQQSDLLLASFDVAWGVDVDLRTPLGPLRLGYAWNLTEVPEGEPVNLWHFGIGYPW